MKKIVKRVTALLLTLLIFAGACIPALSAWEDFSDISGHWAEPVLERAYSDGLLQGFDDNTLKPDEPITASQMAAILCRVLSAQLKSGDYASAGLSGEEWYADAALKALALGLFSDLSGIESAMTRESALAMMAKAFQLCEAEPDYSALEPFSDSGDIKSENRRAIASLVSMGYVQGFAGLLNVGGAISRAEFIAVLYRVASNYTSVPGSQGGYTGGTVISEVTSLSGFTSDSGVWLDCSTGGVMLQNVNVPQLVLRSQRLGSVSLTGTSSIDRLVLASSGSSSVSLFPYGSASIGTVVVGDMSGSAGFGGNIDRVEIISDNKTVTINGAVSELVVAGSGNTVTINSGARAGAVRIVRGESGNNIIINGQAENLTDLGGSSISGYGGVTNAEINSAYGGSISVSATNLVDLRDKGIEDAALTIEVPDSLPAGETFRARALLESADYSAGRTAAISWYLDGELIESGDISLETGEAAFEHKFEYSREMALEHGLRAAVSYTTADGIRQETSAEAVVRLENYDEEYYKQYEKEAVLARVTTGYKGNYTLEWALANDYDKNTKKIWINAKGYASTTKYIIWISLAYQRVNIFEGSKENWELKHEFLCGSGAPGTATPVGVYTVFGKQTGWFTSTYTCRPVVNFKTGSGYAFHSRLYKPGWSEEFTDARIGFPISHGCLRMYSEDIQWMYDNIPIGTTVVVF